MLNLLTVYASLLAIALTVEFCLGLVTLWNTTKPVLDPQPPVFDKVPKTPIQQPQAQAAGTLLVDDVWLLPYEAATPQKQAANEIIKSSFTYQLCLPAAPVEVPTVDFMSYSIRHLKSLAKERKLKNYGKMVKTELIQALS